LHFDTVRTGWSENRVEHVFGTAHHPSAVLWDQNAAKCWFYSFSYLPTRYTFCFGTDHRLVLKAKGVD
jgi:hypothetical protein